MSLYVLYFIIYPILAVTLFYITNWIGKNAYSFGYHKIDFIVDREDSAAFNFSLKVLTPTIFIILLSAAFYHLNLDYLTINIYLVVIYSVLIRIFINLFMGRLHILDWKLQIFYAITICVVGYMTYEKLIVPKAPLIPDFNTISNELWILIGLFIYSIVNKIELSEAKKERRISNYILIKHKSFSNLYKELIESTIDYKLSYIYKNKEFLEKYNINKGNFKEVNFILLKLITYSIMIFEDFNRPVNARKIEYFIAKHSSKEKTLGVMQVKTNQLISDEESIRLGIDKIVNSFCSYLMNYDYQNGDYFYFNHCKYKILSDYNLGDNYSESVESIFNILSKNIHKADINELWIDTVKESLQLLNYSEDSELV